MHKESVHHNFQKHTVTTIKKLLVLKTKGQKGPVEECGHAMWQLFLRSKVKTKRVLTILFGHASFDDPVFRKMLEKYGLLDILSY